MQAKRERRPSALYSQIKMHQVTYSFAVKGKLGELHLRPSLWDGLKTGRRF